MSENPVHPDAHPTAPGGMSRKALIAELVDEWEYVEDSDWDSVTWPQLIQMVVDERAGAEPDEGDEAEDGLHLCRGCGIELDADDTRGLCGECEDDPDVEPDEPYEDTEGDFDTSDQIEELVAEMEEKMNDDIDAILSEGGDPNPGIFKAATTMFADEGDDPMIDADTGLDIDALLDEFEDFTVDPEVEMGKAIADEDGFLDPEALFEEMFAARAEVEASQPAPLFLGIPGVMDYIFDGHAGAGPSGAERWMNCTMSLSASRKFLETLTPNQQREYAKSGTAARQGTTAHAVAEVEANHMLGRVDESEVETTLLELTINPEHEDEAYDEEMADYVGEYVDLVKSYAQERGADAIQIERRVGAAIPLVGVHEGEVYVIHGSGDLTVDPTPEDPSLVVGDLKYGEGIEVDVDENPQIREYALGVLGEYIDDEGNLTVDIEKIIYHIIQPRLGGIKTWEESVDDLLAWRDDVLAPALTKALYGAPEGATFEPSELACQWCPARGSCPALAESRIDSASELFDAVVEAEYENGPGSFPETTSLTNDRLGELLLQANAIEKLRKDLREEAQRRLMRGESVTHFDLRNYSPRRVWAEDAEIDIKNGGLGLTPKQQQALFTKPELVSPTQAEAALGKEVYAKIEDLVVKPSKVPVISTGPMDRRSKWEGRAPEDMFADEGEDES